MALRIQIVRSETAAAPRRRRRWTVVAATVVSVGLLSGVSYAWWSATGTGSATVASTNAVGLLVGNVSVVADLYPGKTDPLSVKVTNNNPYNVSVDKITALTVTSSDTTNCPVIPANVTINSAYSPVPAGGYNLTAFTVNGGGGTATFTLPSFITMTTTAGNGCQGVTFTATMTVTGMQV